MDSKKMDIVMDVKVQVTVQLGTAQLPMKEIVELSPGSQIQLKHQIKHTEAKSSTKQNTKVKNIDRKESILNYWWILLILIIIYSAYKWQSKLRLL